MKKDIQERIAYIVMRKSIVIVIALITMLFTSSVSEGLLPTLDEVYGVEVPSFADVIKRFPDSVQETEKGTVLTYSDVEDSDYYAYGELLKDAGCEVENYSVYESNIEVVVSQKGKSFTFSYNIINKMISIVYPEGVFENIQYVRTSAKPEIGDIVRFGSYEQDNDTENGPEEIEWIVLDYDEANNKALVISKYGLDVIPYHESNAFITWEGCTMRTWLNDAFLKSAFSPAEQSAILITNVNNGSNQGYSIWNAVGGNDTQDKIFLLSYAEANRYFCVTQEDNNNIISRVSPTKYAIAQGAWNSDIKKTTDGNLAGWWWLRSPGLTQGSAAGVSLGGSLHSGRVDRNDGVVRPALWLNLDSDLF